jgi:hypothetical protein
MRRVWLASVVAAVVLVAIPGTAAASTYTNPNPVAISEGIGPGDPPEVGKASPYPSTITVSDLPGAVTRVRATLNNLSHAYPADLGIILVAPAGNYTGLIWDICGDDASEIVNQTFTFDDAAATTLPPFGPCLSGTYRPTIRDVNDPGFAPPAPQGVLPNAAMSNLNGSPASGTWQLFIFDDACCDNPPPENILAGGWTLDLLTDATCSGRAATLTGTAGDDELIGTEGDDVILGFGGKDSVLGLGGNDLICGGDARDTLRGGVGKDRLVGQAANDTLRGQGGKDTLLGKGGPDKLNGGTGKDVCKGGKKDDTAKKCEVEKSI